MKLKQTLIVWALVVVVAVLAQVTPTTTYMHPKPRPTIGVVTNFFNKRNVPFAPINYGQENAVAWSIDIAGGLHSRMNSTDRLALSTNWTEEGAIVYDASDRTFYGVGTNLIADKPLFTLDGIASGATGNIYTTNGTLTSDRFVDLTNHMLRFTGTGDFTVQAGSVGMSGSTNYQNGTTNMVIGSNGRLDVRAPGYITANAGDLLALEDPLTGSVKYRPDVSIYTTNGTLTGPRIVTTGPNELRFEATGGSFVIFNGNLTRLGGLTNWLIGTKETWINTGGSGTLKIGTTNVANLKAQIGDSLNLTSADGTGYADFGPPRNLYTADGTLTTNRTVNFANRTLDFIGPGSRFQVNDVTNFTVVAKTNSLTASEEADIGSSLRFKMNAPSMNASANGKVLTVKNGTTREVDFQPFYNIYNTNGTLIDDRTVTANFKDFKVLNSKFLQLDSADTLGLYARTNLWLRTPSVLSGSAQTNSVLTLLDQTTGRSEFMPLPGMSNIYTANGTITGARTVGLGANQLMFDGLNLGGTFRVSADLSRIAGKTNMIIGTEETWFNGAAARLRWTTPRVNAAGQPGDVLMLTVAGPSALADFYPTTNIYSADGTILANRTVLGAGRNLSITNIGSLILNGVTTTVAGTNKLYVVSPTVGNRTAANGYFLQLKDVTTGESDFAQVSAGTGDGSIYANDGTLSTATRILNLVGKRLVFEGSGAAGAAGAFDVNATGGRFSSNVATNDLYSPLVGGQGGMMRIGGQGQTIINTPGTIANAASKNGMVLTWDGTKSEYQPITTSGFDTSIYSTNGTLQGPRLVTGNNQNLDFNGINTFNLDGQTTTLSGRQRLNIITPNVNNLSAQQGQVLTLRASGGSGQSEWQDLPPNWNVYNTNGTLSGDRLITANNYQFGVYGSSWAYLHGTTAGLYASSKLYLATPRASVGPVPSVGWVLGLTNVNGECEWMPIADKHLSTDDASLIGTRYIYGNGQQLNINGTSLFDVNSSSVSIKAASSGTMKLLTPKASGGTAPPGYLLTYRSDGTCDFDTAPSSGSGLNLYNGNGTMAGTNPRDVTGAGWNLNFNDFGSIKLQTRTDLTLDCGPNGHLLFKTTKLNNGDLSSGSLYLKLDPATARVEFEPIDYSSVKTLYSQNGDLATPRTVNGAGNNLTFQNIPNFTVQGGNVSVSGTGSIFMNSGTGISVQAGTTLNLSAPATGSLTAFAGANVGVSFNGAMGQSYLDGKNGVFIRTQRALAASKPADGEVLKYRAAIGDVEFSPLPAPPDTLYSKDGTLASDRKVSGGTAAPFKTLTFENIGAFSALAGSATVAGNATFGTAGAGKLIIKTARMNSGSKPADGEVLKYRAATDDVEFGPDLQGSGGTSLYGIYTGTSTASGSSSAYTITLANPQPSWTGAYVNGMRASTQVTNGLTGNQLGDHKFVLGTGNSPVSIVGADGNRLRVNELTANVTLDLVYVQGIKPGTGTALERAGWLMVNTGWRSSSHSPALAAAIAVPPNTYTGVGTVTAASQIGQFDIEVKTTDPTFTRVPGNPGYPTGMRIAVTFRTPDGSGFSSSQTGQAFKVGDGDWVSILAGDGNQPANGALFEGATLDLIYMPSLIQAGTGREMGPAFVPANNTGTRIGGLEFPGIATQSPVNPAKVSVVTFAGVVDTFAELADVPLTFKKVSTLGFNAVGDGRHADYFLGSYEPKVRGRDGIQSSVDPTRMWKRLK